MQINELIREWRTTNRELKSKMTEAKLSNDDEYLKDLAKIKNYCVEVYKELSLYYAKIIQTEIPVASNQSTNIDMKPVGDTIGTALDKLDGHLLSAIEKMKKDEYSPRRK